MPDYQESKIMKYRITMQSTSQDVSPPEVITAEASTFMGAALDLLKQWETRFTFDNPFSGIFEALAELAQQEGDGTADYFEMSEPEAAFTKTGEMIPGETIPPSPETIKEDVKLGLILALKKVVEVAHRGDGDTRPVSSGEVCHLAWEAIAKANGETIQGETFTPRPNRVFIRVSGGVVQGATADDPKLEAIVIDYDNGEQDEAQARENADADKIADTLTAVL